MIYIYIIKYDIPSFIYLVISRIGYIILPMGQTYKKKWRIPWGNPWFFHDHIVVGDIAELVTV